MKLIKHTKQQMSKPTNVEQLMSKQDLSKT